MPGEFDLIQTYFTRPARRARLGVGDDCALIDVPAGMEVAVSTDMLVEGVHFLAGTDAQRLGHKTLAVNLSDLAAMGATPRYATLAIALPTVDQSWLAAFSRGFFMIADVHDVELMGGDTTRGPLNVCVTLLGEVPAGTAVKRSGAQAGDEVWVSGTLGDAALGLAYLLGQRSLTPAQAEYAVSRLEVPTPRVTLGIALRGIASAMLDLSDGLAGDLRHIAQACGLDAVIEADALPFSTQLAPAFAAMTQEQRLHLAAGGGDDYELCFTAPVALHRAVRAAAARCGVAVTKIGRMTSRRGALGAVLIDDAKGNPCAPTVSGYDHFGNHP